MLCAVLCAALLLTACGAGGPAGSSGPSGQLPGGSHSGGSTYHNDLITELYSEDGSFENEWGDQCAYSLHVPQIAADTAAAAAINSEIASVFGASADSLLDSMAQGYAMADAVTIRWESQWSGHVLSLVVSEAHPDAYTYYAVYHYDFDSGRQLTGSQLLALLGTDEGAFMADLRRQAAAIFDTMNVPMQAADVLVPLRAQTLAAVGDSADDVLFRPNGDGAYVAYVRIGTAAGAGWDTRETAVCPAESVAGSGAAPDDRTDDYQAAVVNGGTSLDVSFRGTDRTYPVAGCYHCYDQVKLADFDGITYAFLRTAEGYVEAVDVTNGIAFESVASMGPLFGITDIAYFREGVRPDGGSTLWAIAADGGQYDLTDFVQTQDAAMTAAVTGTWQTADESVYLTIDEYSACSLYLRAAGDGYAAYRGAAAPVGMGDSGLVCGYAFYDTAADNGGFSGAWGVSPDLGGLTVRPVAGEFLLGDTVPVMLNSSEG